MDDSTKNYVDMTEREPEDGDALEARTLELDISDVEQIIPEDKDPDAPLETKPRKKGWIGLLSFTGVLIGICAVSIFLLTSVFHGGFLSKTHKEPTVTNEVIEEVEVTDLQSLDDEVLNGNGSAPVSSQDPLPPIPNIVPSVTSPVIQIDSSPQNVVPVVPPQVIPTPQPNQFEPPATQQTIEEPEPHRETP